jgi:hypothetical protein
VLKPVLGKYASGVSSGVHTDVLRFEIRINSGHSTQLYNSKVLIFLSLGIFSLAFRHLIILKLIYFKVCKLISTGVIRLCYYLMTGKLFTLETTEEAT